MRGTKLVVSLITAAGLLPLAPAAAPSASTVDWKPCADLAKDWSPEDKLSECATVTVPVDYAKPDGRTIDIAVSRLKATDAARRKGFVLFNPGGPGQAGIHLPTNISESEAAGIGADHDLIGFDPRGVQYSADVACPSQSEDSTEPPASLSGKEKARFVFERDAKVNQRCVDADPEFVRNLTTGNIAKDMDRIRVALGEDKISYYGVSWGTALGASYRTQFDGHVDKMLLDSVMSPTLDLAGMDDAQAAAGDVTVHDFAGWLARYESFYHFGTTHPEVLKALLDLRRQFVEHPKVVGEVTIDGDTVNNFLGGPRRDWARSAEALVILRDGGVPDLPGIPARATGWDITPDGGNFFQQKAILCNESTAARDFETIWQRREERIRKYPAAGWAGSYDGMCAGWTLPVQPWAFGTGKSALQLVGHLYEPVTPIGWTWAMRKQIGGAVLTVEDDHHGSLSSLPCANKAVDFFSTGKTSADSCSGLPIPAPKA